MGKILPHILAISGFLILLTLFIPSGVRAQDPGFFNCTFNSSLPDDAPVPRCTYVGSYGMSQCAFGYFPDESKCTGIPNGPDQQAQCVQKSFPCTAKTVVNGGYYCSRYEGANPNTVLCLPCDNDPGTTDKPDCPKDRQIYTDNGQCKQACISSTQNPDPCENQGQGATCRAACGEGETPIYGSCPSKTPQCCRLKQKTSTNITAENLFCNGDKTMVSTAIGCLPTGPEKLVAALLSFAIGISGGIAFLFILLGGFQVLTSQGNPERLNAGKEMITAAITGLILIIFSVFLLRIIGFNILGIFPRPGPQQVNSRIQQ